MGRDTLTWKPGRPGVRPLAPRRDLKIQICLSHEERALLDACARAAGFESVAGYVRSRALGQGATTQPDPLPAA